MLLSLLLPAISLLVSPKKPTASRTLTSCSLPKPLCVLCGFPGLPFSRELVPLCQKTSLPDDSFQVPCRPCLICCATRAATIYSSRSQEPTAYVQSHTGLFFPLSSETKWYAAEQTNKFMPHVFLGWKSERAIPTSLFSILRTPVKRPQLWELWYQPVSFDSMKNLGN